MEIGGDTSQIARRCGAKHPHQQEEGHHGRYEVSVGDFPSATVMPVPALLNALNDNNRRVALSHAAYFPLTALVPSSSSANEGRW